jgi:hypothetical protein
MSTSAAANPGAASAREDVLAILGAELVFVGWLAALIAWRLGPEMVILTGGAIAVACAVLCAALGDSPRGPTAAAVVALYCSFASTVPGILFFVELLNRQRIACYDLPWHRASASMLLLGPLLLFVSTQFRSWRVNLSPLSVLGALHGLVWLVGTGNTLLCAMTI